MLKAFLNAYQEFWIKATDFKGFTSLSDWWFVQLANLIISLINKHASKFFTLYFFYIFIHLYNGAILERLAKSKKVNKYLIY